MSYIDISSKNHTTNMNRIDDNQMISCDDNKSFKFTCEKCEFKCARESQYKRHLSTTKHKNRHNELDNTSDEHKEYKCDCGSIYKERSGLWRHKQKCRFQYSSSSNVRGIVSTSVPETDTYLAKIMEHHSKQTEELKNFIIHHSELHQQQTKEHQQRTKEHQQQMKEHQQQNNKQFQEIMDIIKQATAINN